METTLALFLSLPLIHNKTPVVLLPGNTARLTQRSVLSTCTWSTRTQKNALLIVSNSRVNLPRTDRGGNVMIRLFRLCCHNTSVCVRLLQFCWGLKNTSHLPVNAPAHPHTHTHTAAVYTCSDPHTVYQNFSNTSTFFGIAGVKQKHKSITHLCCSGREGCCRLRPFF